MPRPYITHGKSSGMNNEYKMRAKIWVYQGKAFWHFVTLPKKQAAHIKSHHGWARKARRGWASIRVTVTIGKTSWKTSIFPEKETGSYVLPLKEKVRVAERLKAGTTIGFKLKIEDR